MNFAKNFKNTFSAEQVRRIASSLLQRSYVKITHNAVVSEI